MNSVDCCCQVSVVIPCFNSSSIISKALDSLVKQSFKEFEVILVDDGSLDFEALSQLVETYKSHLNIQLIALPANRGAPTARNVGVRAASGEFIAFLDSDDVWHESKLVVQLSVMKASGATISAHGYIDDIQFRSWPKSIPSKIEYYDISTCRFIMGNPFSTPTVMVKRSGFIAFDERFRVVDDYRCWIENVNNGRAIYIKHDLAAGFKPAIGGGGLTSNLPRMHKACLEVLGHMYHDHVISLPFYFLAWGIEQLKYPARKIKCSLKGFFER